MIELVVALMMYHDGKLIEHTPKENMVKCLKSKRIAQREVNPQSVRFSCNKIKAETEIYMGAKKIVKIISLTN